MFIENHVSEDEPETSQKATYAQVVTGNQIGNTDGTEWYKFGPKEKKASEGLLKSYGSLKKNKRPLKAYQSHTESSIRLKGESFGV